MVNPKDSPYGRIFTIIHELGSCCPWGKVSFRIRDFGEVSYQNIDPIETFCNQVAAEVLVPHKRIVRDDNAPEPLGKKTLS